MNFGSQALRKCFICILVALLYVPGLLAQQVSGFGAATKPHTVVYKLLKPTENSNARVGASDKLKHTLEQLKPKKHLKKFPEHGISTNARKSASSNDLSLIYELEHSPNIPFDKIKRDLMATGQVAYVEPLYQRAPFHQPNDPAADSTKTTQYYLKLIQAYSAWDIEKGDATVVVGVLDTGFLLSHTEMQGKVAQNTADPIDGLDNDGDGLIDNLNGWDFADRDNNVFDVRSHGNGVAGVVSARANNGVGLAGVGYNIKFMPLKVFPSTNKGSFAGYEAIVYAAEKGCKVINLSWGGDFYSQYEQDIINYVVLEKDVVVIASAGNGNGNQRQNMYPASYEHVISVGGTDQKDLKVTNYTYGYHVDVAAPSSGIYTTHVTSNNGYNITSGTSFGGPMVAATAALVRSKYPNLNALQVMERVRVATDDIYHLPGNQPYREMLGKGRLNVKKALGASNLKSVRSISFKTEKNRPLQSGQTTDITTVLTNYLSPTQNLQVTLTSVSPYVTIANSSITLGTLATAASANNAQSPFKITVSADAPANTMIALKLGYTDGTYTDYQYYEMLLNPNYLTLETDHIKMSLNGKGNIGYNGALYFEGEGFNYQNNGSLLYEGGFMVATAPNRVSDNVRNENWENDENFTPLKAPKVIYNSALADQTVMGVMQDKFPAKDQAGIEVKYRSYTWNTPGNKDFLVIEYQLKNITSEVISSLHAGLFADWDIGTYYENAADWDAARSMGYVYSKTTSNLPYTGIKLLTPDQPSYYALEEGGKALDLYNLSEAAKYKAMASGISNAKAGTASKGKNVAHVVGAVAKDLAPGEVKTIAFAILAGTDLQHLQLNADAALAKYKSIKTGPVPLAFADTVCAGNKATWIPQQGKKFNFYDDASRSQSLSSGNSYTINWINQEKTVYATNADSLFESAAGSATFSLPRKPAADFSVSDQIIYPGQPVRFQNNSKFHGISNWKFSDSEVQNVQDVTFTFPAPGTYDVTLTVTDRYGCTSSTLTKQVKVLHSTTEVLDDILTLYPNPANETINIQLLPDGAVNQKPVIVLIDAMGRQVQPDIKWKGAMQAELNLQGLSSGVYTAQIIYNQVRFTRRIIVM